MRFSRVPLPTPEAAARRLRRRSRTPMATGSRKRRLARADALGNGRRRGDGLQGAVFLRAQAGRRGHLVERLNKGFGFVGMSLDPTKYKSPMDMYARGLVGQRVLPLVAAGTTAVALDRTAGGLVNPKDKDGNRVYSPLVLGAAASGIAHGQAALAGIMPGGQTYDQKYNEIFNGEVPIRSGRWWPPHN